MKLAQKALIYFLVVVSIAVLLISAGIAAFLAWGFDASWREGLPWMAAIWVMAFLYIPGEAYARRTGHIALKLPSAVFCGMVLILMVCIPFALVAVAVGVPKLWGVIGALIVTVVLTLWAIRNAVLPPVVKRFSVRTGAGSRLLRIVHISDIHLDGTLPLEWTRRLVASVNALEPDVIAFTGDLFDLAPFHLQGHFEVLRTLKARVAKVAVSGNHDFYAGYDVYGRELEPLGFISLDNEWRLLEGVQFAGVSDSHGGWFGTPPQPLDVVLRGVDRRLPIVLLRHQPEEFEQAVRNGVIVQLSGHTHGGQLPPWGVLSWARYRYHAGFKSYRDGWIHTIRGTGTWGPPMRLWGRLEIGLIEFRY